MGLATIDPHSQKVQTKLYKIPKFGATKLGDFVNLGVLFLTTVCGSIVANPIIYRLVPSPSRFETRQLASVRHFGDSRPSGLTPGRVYFDDVTVFR